MGNYNPKKWVEIPAIQVTHLVDTNKPRNSWYILPSFKWVILILSLCYHNQYAAVTITIIFWVKILTIYGHLNHYICRFSLVILHVITTTMIVDYYKP